MPNCKLFGVILNDSSNPLQLQNMAKSLLDATDVKGIVLGGWYNGETSDVRQQTVSIVRSIQREKGIKSLPLMVHGADSLEQVRICTTYICISRRIFCVKVYPYIRYR